MLKEKKGFTMIEMLATVTLMLLLAAILIPSIMSVSDNVKKSQYESQIELILAGAKDYGNDNLNSLNGSTCTNVTVQTLIDGGYVKANSSDKTEIINPMTNESMNSIEVCVKYENLGIDSSTGKPQYKVTTSIVE